MNSKTILVLSNSQDGEHTDVVIEKIQSRGQRVFRLDVDMLSRGETKIVFSADANDWSFMLHTKEASVKSYDIQSVWYRRPNVFDFQIKDSVQKQFAENELRSFLEGLWYGLDHAFWMNNPHSLERARKKMLQLKLAREVGFAIPDTIVTNNPDEARIFLSDHGDNVIFKPIQQPFLDYGDRGFSIKTTLLTQDHAKKLDLVKSLPSLFQQHIEKSCDVRVTIVGEQIFAIEIGSQEFPETAIDWRRIDFFEKIKNRKIQLPRDVASSCLQMMQKLDLVFGAFDFAIDKDGRFIFFEINANGQWYWIEYLTQLPIANAIAELLS